MRHFLILITLLTFCSCDPMDDRLVFKNSTNDTLVVRLMFDSELPNNPRHWNRSRIFLVAPLEKKKLSIFNKWEGEFERALPEGAINVLVTKYYDFETYPYKWDTIYSNGFILKKKYNLKQIEDNNWKIIYPTGFKRLISIMLEK
ncbi:hypothetical protein ACFSX9_00395 [Flavobacterium ardleyense]|uniref:Lipoprotein n=1 Tax=Flavobacterium ardleyense TaxID=2038737 RepID=A0ABW5Z3H5_9FLAO